MSLNCRTVAIAMLSAVVAAPVFVSAATLPYGKLKWREIGPAVSGGRVAAVAGFARNPRLYYLGSAGGGLWKSENGGLTWESVLDKISVAAIGAVAIDPTNENVVWVGTGEANPRNDVSFGNGVYKTTDGGKHWQHLGLDDTLHISSIAIDPQHPNTVLVGALGNVFADSSARGIYRTTDGGRRWQRTLYVGPASGVSDLAMDPRDPRTLYAGIWQFRRVPWTFSSGGPQDGLYKSTDGGQTWRKLTGGGLPAGITGRIGLAIAPSNPRRVYAVIEARGGILWRSDDRGNAWRMVSRNTLVDQRPFYFSHIAVDPKNQNHVYAISEMLAESKDGGRSFKETAKDVHVDYHAIWIAPNDPSRIITGEDGGYALTVDGGKHWAFSRNLAIGQVYHVGLGNDVPYTVCAPLQDNNGFCGPANSLNREGIPDEAWQNVIFGDGMWAVPDLSDPNYVYSDLQDGNITVFNRKTGQNQFIRPYYAASAEDFHLYDAKYRFNWDSPIALNPFDPKTVWYGGNVVFESRDRGAHWTPISPDLTLNLKAHQQPAGGPLALDVSGAEFSDNLLDIEGSTLARGEIWVGSDDGLVQLTRDGGKTWSNVTPSGVPPFGRVETVAPSYERDGTAYAGIDRHRLGDRRPYLFVTDDFGRTWRSITSGLPNWQYVRTVRPDIHNSNLLYAGTEEGIWISYDRGAHWQNFNLNIPAVSVRDIRPQPDFNDLAIATHGRSLWILDDIRPFQELPQAQAAGVMLFKPRTAYEFAYHSNDEGLYTRYAGQNPPGGATINFYQAKPQKKTPVIEILDTSGAVIRQISGTHKVGKRNVANVTNDAGLNRVVWNFQEDGPVQWLGALREEYRGPKTGAVVVPGTYTARTALGGKTFSESFQVKADPRLPWTPADYQAVYAFTKRYYSEYSHIDAALNGLDAVKKAVDGLAKSARAQTVSAAIAALRQAQGRIFDSFTANYANDEDSIQRPGGLREDVEGLFELVGPPQAPLIDYAQQVDARYNAAMMRYNSFASRDVGKFNDALRGAGLQPIKVPAAVTFERRSLELTKKQADAIAHFAKLSVTRG